MEDDWIMMGDGGGWWRDDGWWWRDDG